MFAFSTLVLAVAAQIQDPVELEIHRDVPGDELFVGQHLPLHLEIWVDAEFQQQQLVSLFRQPLDVPLEVRWPDLQPGPDRVEPFAQASMVINGRLGQAEVLDDRWQRGRRQHGYRLTRTMMVAQAGTVDVPTAEVRFGFATKFREDLINGRVAEDQQTGQATTPPLQWNAAELPMGGRPATFHGAIGHFQLHAVAKEDSDQLAVELKLTGSGNWGSFAPPPWPVESDFHCLGIREEGGRYTYDLKPLTANPAPVIFYWSYFDPVWPAGYRTLQSEPLQWSISGVAPQQQREAGTTTTTDSPLITAFLIIPWVSLAVVLWRVQAWRKKLYGSPREDSQPLVVESDHAEQWDSDARALADELASRLRCRPAALVCPNLGQRLQQHGMAEDLATESALAFEQLIAARYGGPNQVQQPAQVDDLLQRLRAAQ